MLHINFIRMQLVFAVLTMVELVEVGECVRES